jgi:hypothetical protein
MMMSFCHTAKGLEFALKSSDRFFVTETGNDPLDVPGFDLEGVCEEDVASGTVLIAGLSPRPAPATATATEG